MEKFRIETLKSIRTSLTQGEWVSSVDFQTPIFTLPFTQAQESSYSSLTNPKFTNSPLCYYSWAGDSPRNLHNDSQRSRGPLQGNQTSLSLMAPSLLNSVFGLHYLHPKRTGNFLSHWTPSIVRDHISSPRLVGKSHQCTERFRPSPKDDSIQIFTDASIIDWGAHLDQD